MSHDSALTRDVRLESLGDLGDRQRAEHAQQVGDAFDVLGAAIVGESLQLVLGALDDLGVEQLAQLGPSEQLGEQGRVERQC